jgi:ABC-type bacteriocin/lantibiotic exporter with double-glycine peptidase domain
MRLSIATGSAKLVLNTRHFRQSHAMCGPASLRIVLAYFGKTASERVIGRACRSTDASGTTGSNLLMGAQRLGLNGRIIDGATFRTIERWLRRDVPVIVDWMSAIARHPTRMVLPCGHYSVVCGLDRTHIILQDPAIGRRRTILRPQFLHLWYDFKDVRPSARDLLLRRLIVIWPRRAPPGGRTTALRWTRPIT